jgi:hypothetical protein
MATSVVVVVSDDLPEHRAKRMRYSLDFPPVAAASEPACCRAPIPRRVRRWRVPGHL